MYNFFKQVLLALESGGALLSIVEADGSAPRGVGAKMLVRADGSSTGTIGGGAIEYQAQNLAAAAIADKASRLQAYSLSPGDASSIGMVCGGNVTVSIQYLDSADVSLRQLYTHILHCVQEAIACKLVTRIRPAGCSYYLHAPDSPLPLPADLVDLAAMPLGVYEHSGERYVVEPLVSGDRVILFGAGHVGQELSFFLQRLNMYHIVFDDREEFLTESALPCANKRHLVSFNRALQDIDITENDDIVIMTRGHMHDYTLLRDALATPARYIGMIGSRSKVSATFDRLRKEGATPADIARVHAPIGLPIGGKTPQEVALSVAAQLVQNRYAASGD